MKGFEMTSRRSVLQVGAAVLTGACSVSNVFAQSYPTRVVKIIVPYPAGGGVDLTGRVLAEALSKRLGQSVIVENRAGANGMIGMEAVFRAEPDGYTLALTGASSVSAGPHLAPIKFDPVQMEHITRLVKLPLTLAVRNDFPAKNIAEFIEYARANTVNYGSAGVGSSQHLTAEMFRLKTQTKLNHVPYKGSGPLLTDLMAGVIDVSFGDTSLIRTAKSGKVRLLGSTSDGVWKFYPELPVLKNSVPGMVAENWYGLAAPPQTPAPVIARLYEAVGAAMSDPETRKKFEEAGLEPALMPTAEFRKYIASDYAVWGEVIKQANIKL
jgi:tripartite-type tricarboxylate transporter receptor subunit TctC